MKTKQTLAALAALGVLSATSLCAMPQIGDMSPRFAATDQNTNRINLAAFIGKKNVLLYFYPKDFTPECTKEACGFRDRLPEFEKNDVVVIGVSFDSIESHFQFATQNHLNFSLISDPQGKIAYAFGARVKGTNLDNRVSFLIDTQGHIVQITESKDPEKHFQEMEEAIALAKREHN